MTERHGSGYGDEGGQRPSGRGAVTERESAIVSPSYEWSRRLRKRSRLLLPWALFCGLPWRLSCWRFRAANRSARYGL